MRGSPIEKLHKYKVNGILNDESFEICNKILYFLDEHDISEFSINNYRFFIEFDIIIQDIGVFIDVGDSVRISKIAVDDYIASTDLENLTFDQWDIIHDYLSDLL